MRNRRASAVAGLALLLSGSSAIAQEEVFDEELESGGVATPLDDLIDEDALDERHYGGDSGVDIGGEEGIGESGTYALSERPAGASAFAIEASAVGQIVSFDNADLAELDESNNDAIQDTDDRTTFGRTFVELTAIAQPVDAVTLDLTLDAFGSWGSSSNDSSVALGAASASIDVVDTDTFRLGVRAGRQRFGIGGAPRDYYLNGMVDGFTFDAEVVDILTLRVLAFDMFHPQERPEFGGDVLFARPQGEVPRGQRGETNTYRTGAVLQTVDQLVEGLDVRAFFFHATVGGTSRENGTGSDISEGGLLGNFRDRDYQRLFGLRAGYSAGLLEDEMLTIGGFAEFARSSGVDRKESTGIDIDTSGNALGLGLELDVELGDGRIGFNGDWHRMDGAQYSVNGLEFQRGFVSMFGDRIGGLASGSIASMRPSASLSRFGVLHNPDDVDRNAGTDFTHLELTGGYQGFNVSVGLWLFADTRSSNFDQSTLATIEPPPEHSREEFAAQVRTGLALGQELDIKVSQSFQEFAELFVRGGVFMPGDYYALPVARSVTPQYIEGNARLGGQATFWAISAGAEFGLGYRKAR